MIDRRGTHSRMRWWLAASIGPELVALVLSVVLVLAVILASGLTSPASGRQRTPEPASEPMSLLRVQDQRDQAPADQPAPRRNT
jgi:hypothetical protein